MLCEEGTMGTIQGSIVLLQEEGKVGFSMLIHEGFFFFC